MLKMYYKSPNKIVLYSVNNNELAITDPVIGTLPYINEIEHDMIYTLAYWDIGMGNCSEDI